MLGSDTISGLKEIYYRAFKGYYDNAEWHAIGKAIPRTLNLHFDTTGFYRVQLKATDIAGNESITKEFRIKIG